jgi:protein AroM
MTDPVGPVLAAITIGQAPRPDLLAPIRERLPGHVALLEFGALDDLAATDLPVAGASPLTTRLRDGRPVVVDEAFLAPRVQAAIDRAEAAGASVTLLLCAGGFADLRAKGVLVRPFQAAVEALRGLGARRVGVVVPITGQAVPADRKWRAAGFEPLVRVGPPASADGWTGIDAVVLDFVGHPPEEAATLRGRLAVPVVDLGEAGAAAAADRFR